MSDVSGHDVINAKTRRRSGQLAILALIGITSSAAIADTNPTDAKGVTMVVDAAAARYVRENPQAAAIAIGVVYGETSSQSRSGTRSSPA